MDFLFSSSFDWMMAALMLIVAILLLLPVGEKILDYLSPRDNLNNKVTLKGDARRKYRRSLLIFCLVFGAVEVSAAVIVPIWPTYSMIYILFILADLLGFGLYGKKLTNSL